MKRSYIILFLAILLSVYSVLFAGITGKIAGTVKNAKTGDPLLGANVFIEGTYLGAATDLDGKFFILNVPPGTYSIKTTMMGHKTTTLTDVRVKIDQKTTVNFYLEETIIEGEEVIVIAEKPKIELDLTASKVTVSADEISKAWGITVEEVLSDLPGVNIYGGIRGGFGLHDAYHINGMDMRDVGSNTNFKNVNLSTIEDMELLTGGFNAEYGQANGAILNIVTKNSRDRIHGNISYKIRPAGKYHWGRDIYSEDDFHRTIMCTPEFWNPDTTWRTEWMDPGETKQGYNGSIDTFMTMTPEQRAEWWKKFVNDESTHPQMNYTDRMEWETEATFYGSITPKLGYLISGRYKEGVQRYPSALKYNPEMNFQWNLNYQLIKNTKISVTGVYTKFENSGSPKTNYCSSEDTHHYASATPYIKSPYYKFVYWLWGATCSSIWQVRAPEYVKYLNLQAKLTHTFSPKTYLEVAIQNSRMRYLMSFRDIMKNGFYDEPHTPLSYEKLPVFFQDVKWGQPGDMWKYLINSSSRTIKADLVSQVTNHHQLKTGGIFSYNKFDKVLHDHQPAGETSYDWHVTDLAATEFHPYEGAFYIQDKIEFEGMVINAGVRVDFFNANNNVSANFYDPLMLSDSTEGHVPAVSSGGETLFDIGHISWNPDGSGPGYKATPTRWAVSPRLGISHPISENTVLHFMYGEFFQRPAWQKISGPVVAEVESEQTPEQNEGSSEMEIGPDSTWVHYNYYTYKTPNPALEYEKMTQYEVGIDQNIADMFSLDITMYYKDAHDLTSAGISQGPTSFSRTEMKVESQMGPTLYGDPTVPASRKKGHLGFFETYVNGAWAKVRGVETTCRTKFMYINAELNYTLSFLTTGVYFWKSLYKYFPENNLYSNIAPNNGDGGINGTDDDSWNPHNSAYLKITVNSPKNFGPSMAGFHPFGGWTIHTSTKWTQGSRFTYYPPGLETKERVPNNRIWKDKWNTNMSIIKRIGLFNGVNARFNMQIRNLFNQKNLKLPGSSSDRIDYFENGILPRNSVTKEPLEWSWYSNNPREIYFGMTLEF